MSFNKLDNEKKIRKSKKFVVRIWLDSMKYKVEMNEV